MQGRVPNPRRRSRGSNVLAYPGLFRGALDARAHSIAPAMKRAAALALAENGEPDLLLPDPLDTTVHRAVTDAVNREPCAGAISLERVRMVGADQFVTTSAANRSSSSRTSSTRPHSGLSASAAGDSSPGLAQDVHIATQARPHRGRRGARLPRLHDPRHVGSRLRPRLRRAIPDTAIHRRAASRTAIEPG